MRDITHCHNQRPVYETNSEQLFDWNDPMSVSGEIKNPSFNTYHPFIIDIETSADLGQRPILLVGYNTLESRLIVLYSFGYQGYLISKSKIEKMCSEFEPDKITLQNLSQSNFEQFVLKPIADFNQKAKNRNDCNRISLVAHNAPFDIPMMGSPDDSLLSNNKIGQQYEMAVQYDDYKMIGHRAGQFGHIYTFLDSSKSYESLHIPIGDTLVGAKSLWIPGKLGDACESLNTNINVTDIDSHGDLSDEYVEYCINDVFATYELYNALNSRLQKMFGNLPLEHIYSTASIGKYILRKMNYKRVGYSTEAIDVIAPAYFGGRTDAKITGEVINNQRYTDILSQYPTVSKLTNVWDFMQTEYVTRECVKPDDLPKVGDLTKQETWRDISDYYVKIKPKGATLPVRTPHLEDTTKVITAKVHSEKELHYHYMDIIAAKLIDGKSKFDIVSAYKMVKNGEQNLKSSKVAGVDINSHDNVMAKCIEARKNIQLDQGFKDERTNSLKIVANSLYGVSAERIVKETPELPVSERHDFASENGFYNPHVATTITAGGRLQLALGESIAKENGGRLNYCDTDSLIVSDNVVDEVINAFNNLNPYSGEAGDLQVLEDEKGQIGNLYAVGTKKYVFFDNSGEILEVKEHGLGNYDNLRNTEVIKRLWATIMSYDLGENPLNVNILYDGKLNECVLWSFNATTRSMRVLIDQFTDDFIRYGDWIQSTLTYDGNVRYIALDLMEKNKDDEICKVLTENEDIKYAKTVEYSKMLNDGDLKTVRDVVMKFSQDAKTIDEKPNVCVTKTKSVTKEATSRRDIFLSKLEQSFRDNMQLAAKWIFD
ncbi:DNA polymerase [Methanohalobium sp.]|uniref:DNA polymerase n=1 Tax=Methanohalobium sp. TaxID=2837493 RepID=UPI0025E02742|nr:DNA polymerase [Methanohalobium sp.]